MVWLPIFKYSSLRACFLRGGGWGSKGGEKGFPPPLYYDSTVQKQRKWQFNYADTSKTFYSPGVTNGTTIAFGWIANSDSELFEKITPHTPLTGQSENKGLETNVCN